MTLDNKVTLGYGFTENVTLKLGATVGMTLVDPLKPEFGYDAAVSVKF